MRFSKLIVFAAVASASLAVAQAQRPDPPPTPTLAQLRRGFVDPPAAARLRCYWWWVNGHTDEPTITHDLEEMKAKGFGGALLVDANGSDQDGNRAVPAGPTFESPAWMRLYLHALHEADRLGLELSLNITSGWNLGGPSVSAEHASKVLTWSRQQLKGGESLTDPLPQPEVKNGFYRSIAVLAYPLHRGPSLPAQSPSFTLARRSAAEESGFSMPDTTAMLRDTTSIDTVADTAPGEILDLSRDLDATGRLLWKAPPGEWEILRIGYTDSGARVSTSSGAWQGLALDYLSRDAFNANWDETVRPLLEAARGSRSLRTLATDSWELGGANWTDDFADQFRRRRGYDPVPWLPVVAGRIVGDRDQSARFLTDLRRTVADLIAANHYDLFAERAAEYGLGVQAESGGPHGAPIDALETFRKAEVPQSEFWSPSEHRAKDPDRYFTKEVASASHIYGQHFVAQEGETSVGPQWSESLATQLKPAFDMAITEGMNRLVWHEFTSSPVATGLPGQEYFAGTHLNPKVTWWNAGGAFFTYLNRMQFIAQAGTAIDDVLYFYGDNVPNFVRLKADDPAHVLPGYDYDVTNEDALLHSLTVQDGVLTGPSGVTWKALVLPSSGRLSVAALMWIERYLTNGGTVIGLKPESTTGLIDESQKAAFRALADRIWGSTCATGSRHAFGSGKVFCTRDTHSALAAMGVLPDVESTEGQRASSDSKFDYVHYRVGTDDLYVIRNGSGAPVDEQMTFRAQAQQIEQWDAVIGLMSPLPAAIKTEDGRTRLPLRLAPFGSAIIVFPHQQDDVKLTSRPMSQERIEALKLAAPLTLSFQADRGAPAKPIAWKSFESWTVSDIPGVRYFAGTATYHMAVLRPGLRPGEQAFLAFPQLHEVGRIRVNGHDAGTVWAYPLSLRVDPWLRAGKNTIEVEVTNLWPNRIIGDQQAGLLHPVTHTNITRYKKDSPLLPSGLIGEPYWSIRR